MSKLVWDADGTRQYETGTKNGVLFVKGSSGAYGNGVAWNGLTGVTEKPDGAEETELYADDIKYGSIRSAETFGATIEAYTHPDEFYACDGSVEATDGVYIGQQSRSAFGFSYVTQIGDDTVSAGDGGYKLHLVYNATASPSEKSYETINDSPDAIVMSWDITTTATAVNTTVNGKSLKACSTITIDSTKANATKLASLEEILYGNDTTESRLPLPDEVITLMAA